MEKILKLTVNKVWFNMIKSGEKKEEYREIKKHWISRLVNNPEHPKKDFKHYDKIEFKNGYAKDAPTIITECNGVRIGYPELKWSGTMFCDEDGQIDQCFIISIGKEIKNN